jgi:hypothetical protein
MENRVVALATAFAVAACSAGSSPPGALLDATSVDDDDSADGPPVGPDGTPEDSLLDAPSESPLDATTVSDAPTDAGWLSPCTNAPNQCPPGDICTYLPMKGEFLCTRACTQDSQCPAPSSGCQFGLCQP